MLFNVFGYILGIALSVLAIKNFILWIGHRHSFFNGPLAKVKDFKLALRYSFYSIFLFISSIFIILFTTSNTLVKSFPIYAIALIVLLLFYSGHILKELFIAKLLYKKQITFSDLFKKDNDE